MEIYRHYEVKNQESKVIEKFTYKKWQRTSHQIIKRTHR